MPTGYRQGGHTPRGNALNAPLIIQGTRLRPLFSHTPPLGHGERIWGGATAVPAPTQNVPYMGTGRSVNPPTLYSGGHEWAGPRRPPTFGYRAIPREGPMPAHAPPLASLSLAPVRTRVSVYSCCTLPSVSGCGYRVGMMPTPQNRRNGAKFHSLLGKARPNRAETDSRQAAKSWRGIVYTIPYVVFEHRQRSGRKRVKFDLVYPQPPR